MNASALKPPKVVCACGYWAPTHVQDVYAEHGIREPFVCSLCESEARRAKRIPSEPPNLT